MEKLNYDIMEQIDNKIIHAFADKEVADKKMRVIIDTLINKFGEKIFSLIIYKLTHVRLLSAKAKEVWEVIVLHRERLNKALRRDVGINVAAMDYMENFGHTIMKSPAIVDNEYLTRIQKNILVDEVTGLYNKNYYDKRIQEEVAKSKRDKSPLSIILFCIDDFEKVMEYSGAEVANSILKEVSRAVKRSIRVSDVAIRFSTDEFLILLPNTTQKNTNYINDKIKQLITKSFPEREITTSAGTGTYYVNTYQDGSYLYHVTKSAQEAEQYNKKKATNFYTHERRKDKRIPIEDQRKIKLNIVKPSILNEKIEKLNDISKKGIAFNTIDLPLQKMDEIEGIVTKDKHQIKFTGQVVWMERFNENHYRVGVKFMQA
ncbi:MAG: diguanylate cyclase [Spirochaetes bacterium]|nr:diguanylate cyclase [Spirochaetota bacterium]